MRRVTKHYFIPHEHNNFRSKLLHHSSLLILILFLFVTSVSINFVQQQKPEVLGIAYSINQQELLDHTNNARREQGLEPLTLNESLVSAANGKAQHMFSNNYWAHFAPDGTSPWSFIKGSGYQYMFAGENLAKGFTDSKSVVDAWLNSPSHRDNLLSDKYKEIGFAVSEGSIEGVETVLVVQMFGAQDVPATAQPTEIPVVPTVVLSLTPSTVPASSTAMIQEQEIEYHYQPETITHVAPPRITPFFLQLAVENNPFFNLSNVTRAVPMIIVGSLLLALLLDFVIIKRKNIPRIVGHNLDHIMILTMFLLLLLLQKFGSVL
jgi:uncharacterized protein YkwD